MRFLTDHPQTDLGGGWSFAYRLGPSPSPLATASDLERAGLALHPCTVPGNFELDLLALGEIPEPYFGSNIVELRRFERAHVWYVHRFDASPEVDGLLPELVFEGLDCLAEIFLNGERIAATDNMLIEHVVPVAGRLRRDNELVIHFSPPVEAAERHAYPPGIAAQPNCMEAMHVRKAAHMYGWDILPRAVSAGIWRPVSLRQRPPERIEEVYLETVCLSDAHLSATLRCTYRLATAGGPDDSYEFAIAGHCGEATFAARVPVLFAAGWCEVVVTDPQLWWPRDAGPANLYEVECTLLKNGAPVDGIEFTHGIRTVALERTDLTDAEGRGQFLFRVNGEPIFIRGTNWVPADAFHSRDAGRIPRMMELLWESNCNLVRCWGGGVYENDDFFARCDEKGILVWQDFAMACATYPQDADFRRRLAEEVRAVVKRLRQHPSLALWAGDNECDLAFADGWFSRPARDPNANALTREVLPGVLREEDPARPYLPSSPYIGPEAWKGDWRHNLPEAHLWGPRDYFKSDYYTQSRCHFVSEIGYMGCPDVESLRKFLSPDRLWPFTDNSEWILHNTSPIPELRNNDYRTAKLAEHLAALFGAVPDTLDEFVLASQAAQAEAYKFFIELFRGAKWRRTGIVWWNLIDGWPQMSDAVVDYYFAKKLAFDYVARAQQPLSLIVREPEGGSHDLVAANETRQPLLCAFSCRDVDSDKLLAEGRATVPANGLAVLARISSAEGEQRCYRMDWESPLGAGRSHYLAGRPPFSLARYRAWMEKIGFLPRAAI